MRWLVFLGLTWSLAATAVAAPLDPLDPGAAPAAVRRAIFRAEMVAQRGDPDHACEILAGALADGRDHPALRYRLGAYLLDLDRAQEAAGHLRAATAAIAPAAVSAGVEALWRDLGRAEYESSSYAAAARAFSCAYAIARQLSHTDRHQASAAGSPEELLYLGGIAWLLADRADSSLSCLVPLVEDVPDTVPQEWVRALVAAAAQAEQPERAAAGVTRMLRDHPDQAAAWRLASNQSQLAGHLREATIRLQVAHWLAPRREDDSRRLAVLYTATGAPRQAARLYAALWRAEHADADLGFLLAGAWLRAHEPDSARTVLRDALEQVETNTDTTTVRLLTLLGDLEYGERNWADAAAALRRLTALAPDRGRTWLLLGATELQLGLHTEARAALARAASDPAVAERARRLLAQVRPDTD